MTTARSKARPVAAVATAVADPARQPAAGGVVIGFIADLDHDGCPRVVIPGGDDTPLRARSLCLVQAVERGRQCALMYENGDPRQPLILGLLQLPVVSVHATTGDVAVERNGDELVLQAQSAIELRCGEASLRLSADGRVEVRGTTLVSHSTGLNRIRGASIKLN